MTQISDELFARGYDRLYADDPVGAAACFRLAVAVDPAGGEAWQALADTLSGDGTGTGSTGTGKAIAAYRRSVRIDPTDWRTRYGLAEALRSGGEAGEAVVLLAGLAQERPDSAPIRLALARALAAAGRGSEAVGEYREAQALKPDDPAAAVELAAALTGEGDALAAAELLQPLARRMPDDAAVHHGLGRAWAALQEPEKALDALRRASELDPDDRLGSRPLIAGLEAGGTEDLSSAYVRALFDRYADRFDRDLLGKLGYAAPDLLRAAIDRLGVGGRIGRVFDLGCGTGLAGVAFRSLADHLAGVDLSPRMVEKAGERAIYDRLTVGEVVAALEQEGAAAWDLVVAADVLVYLGDLRSLFQATAAALAPGGRFAATVERLEGEEEPYRLGPSRRYAHGEHYLRSLAAASGLTVRLMEPCIPRREKGVGVPGLLFVVERSAGVGRAA